MADRRCNGSDPIDWDRLARFYALQTWFERAAIEAAIEMAEIGVDDRLLDLATGTGEFLRRLARRPAAPAHAVGADRSAAMLAHASLLPPAWRLLRADAACLPFTESKFDIVTAAYLLHLLERHERAEVLAELRRVLRPGGRLLVVTVDAPRGGALGRALDPVFRIARRSKGIMAGLRPLDPRSELENAGFAVSKFRHVNRGYLSIVVLAEAERIRSLGRPRLNTLE